MLELNKIYCCNCLDLMAQMPDEFIDLTVTSPPYDNLRTYNGYKFDFEPIAKELYRVTKKGGVVVWVVGDATIKGSETGTSFRQALYFKECGFNLHDTMIYEKAGCSYPSRNRYNQIFEYMFILSRDKPATNNLIKDRQNKWAGQYTFGNSSNRQRNGKMKSSGKRIIKDIGTRDNIWRFVNGFGWGQSDNTAFAHPAIFPEQLAHDHIYSWSNEGDLVFDPFMGSGTTAKMAYLLKRKWIGCDISQEYVDIANERLSKVTRTYMEK